MMHFEVKTHWDRQCKKVLSVYKLKGAETFFHLLNKMFWVGGNKYLKFVTVVVDDIDQYIWS